MHAKPMTASYLLLTDDYSGLKHLGSLLLHVLLVLQDMLQMLLDSKSANKNSLGLSWGVL